MKTTCYRFAVAGLLALSTIAAPVAAQVSDYDCVVPAAALKDNKGSMVAFLSANTNAGKGNGGEIAVMLDQGNFCIDGLEVEDSQFNYDAKNPLGGKLATDPGNSARRSAR